MSGLKQVFACWDMSLGVTYAASAQCDSNCQSDSMSSELVCEVSKKLLDLEQRSVIKFLTKKGKKLKEILERMVAVYGESAPSYYKVKFWSKHFKWGRVN